MTACPDGRAALEAIERVRPQLVLADWMMPEMDGVELCRQTRARCAAGTLDFTYFVLLTGRSEKQQVVTGLEAGADDYLTKPYDARELLARVRAGLRLSALQRQLTQRNGELLRANDEVLELNKRLEALANTDGLTGLCNRRYFFERFEQAWNQSRREERALGCIMLDIDHFKRVNDTFGHAAGDVVLKAAARICRDAVRSYDLVGRIGGEEFCTLVFPTEAAGVPQLAERIRTALESASIPFDTRALNITASLGVALADTRHATPQQLIEHADALLYRAKQNGRNQVWVSVGPGLGQRYAAELAPLAGD